MQKNTSDGGRVVDLLRGGGIMVQLILSGSQKERLDRAFKIIEKALGSSVKEKGHPDLITPEPALSLGINQIRILQKRLAFKPYSAPVKVALIAQAEKLTIPAQNALLKTLEEPPAKTLIILLAPKKENLLPTIISRCQITQLIQKPEVEIDEKRITYHVSRITSILESGVGERLKLAEKIAKNREEAIEFCQGQLVAWRRIVLGSCLTQDSPGVVKIIRLLQQTLVMLEANVNPRLALENLLLSYPTLPGQSWSRA